MKQPFRPFRNPLTRSLACVLVTLALLVNGMAIAHAANAGVADDCCAGMAAQHGDKAPCHESGNPCPPAGNPCDDQCLARCLGNTVVPSTTVSLPEFFQRQSAQLVLIARASSSPPPDPGLRPPIFV